MMHVSVIIVNWNTKDILLDCLGSVFLEITGDFEVFVVDNNSTDGSALAVKERFPRVDIIQNMQNRGFAKAVNQGVSKARGRYIVLLNSDTVLTPDALETMTRFMDKLPASAVCGPQLLNTDGTRQNSIANIPTLSTELLNKSLLRRLRPKKYPGKERVVKGPMRVESIIGACMVVRKKAIERVGPLDEGFFFFLEETDWCKRMRSGGWEIFFHPGARVYHLQGASAKKVNVPARIEYWISRYRFFKKHRGAVSNCILRAGLYLKLVTGICLGFVLNVFSLFMSKKAREKLSLNVKLISWHFAGCPVGSGLRGGAGCEVDEPVNDGIPYYKSEEEDNE